MLTRLRFSNAEISQLKENTYSCVVQVILLEADEPDVHHFQVTAFPSESYYNSNVVRYPITHVYKIYHLCSHDYIKSALCCLHLKSPLAYRT